MEDRFAAWRGLDSYSVEDAASLCANSIPGRRFRAYNLQDTAEQIEYAEVIAWRKRLAENAEKLEVKVKPEYTSWEYQRDRFTRNGERVSTRHPAEYGPVRHEVLVKWLESIGVRPAFFFPGEDKTSKHSKSKSQDTQEKEYLLRMVGCLAELAGFDLRILPGQKPSELHAEAKALLDEIKARCEGSRDPGTLAKHLKQARAALGPNGGIGPSATNWYNSLKEIPRKRK